jgi:predicted ATPase
MELADDLPGGVLWVDASGMTSADEVLATLGEALGLTGGTSAIKQALPKILGERRTLVVIDGLHGLDIKAAVAVLLWVGPRVSVVVTATSPVGLASEQVLHLRAFSTAGTAQHPSPASGFVMATLQRLGVDGQADMGTVQSSAAKTTGLPSELEQVALDLLTGVEGAPPDVRPTS